jgi:hypothetical protein
MTNPDLIVVATFTSRQEANLARSALEAGGIYSIVFADDAGGVQPGFWEGRGVAVIVRKDDEQAAREILNVAAKRDTSE